MRKPLEFMSGLPSGVVEQDIKGALQVERGNPENSALSGVAQVTQVNEEEGYIRLKIVVGSPEDMDREPIPLTFPGAGKRTFMGVLPEVGDYCTVDWLHQDSTTGSKGTKIPVIKNWIVPGTWPGRDWLTTQPFDPSEFDMGSVKDRSATTGSLHRTRHKLPPLHAGHAGMSSSQGSDVLLGSSVYISNRRGVELNLRDEDSALVTRSIAQFHAFGGGRAYAGPVQRDARSINPTLFSDGRDWAGPLQAENRIPLTESDLPPSAEPEGYLTPAQVLARQYGSSTPGDTLLDIPPELDPYTFFRRGGLVDESGFAQTDLNPWQGYGGKSVFRISTPGGDPRSSLMEYRLEIPHTSTGTLPVTEQTDGFDADRLPDLEPDATGKPPVNRQPFVTFVLGSVVGNDPYTEEGRRQYALPLVARVFDGDTPSPKIQAARLVGNPNQGDSPTPLVDHLASLFRVDALDESGTTFIATNKKGQIKANIAGPQGENSVEVNLQGGMHFQVQGSMQWGFQGPISLLSRGGSKEDNVGVNIASSQGAVKIYGGSSLKGAEALQERLNQSNGGESLLPSVDIEAQTSMRLKASRRILLQSERQEYNARVMNFNATNEIDMQAAERIGISAKQLDVKVTGKATMVFTGPKDFLPTNGALEDKTYATFPGLNAKKSFIFTGDRSEDIVFGNDLQSIRVGNFTYTVNLGTYNVLVGVATALNLTPATFTATSTATAALTATAGVASVTGTTAATLTATAGVATIRGTAGVILSAPADFNIGPIITAGSLDPLTGLPFATWGMGAKFHVVTP